MGISMKKWYKGDTHLHTTNSDGAMSVDTLISECKKIGLEYMIITDHNYNSVEKSYYDGDMLVIQGQELTHENGHVNVWGEKVPHEPPHQLETADDYADIIAKCKEAGATVSMNHPFCSNCPFLLDMEAYPFDCVEVWNTIQHSDNVKNRDWWVQQLLKGHRIAAVGGSDHHRYYAGISLLAVPTTYVLAEEKTKDAVLQALREGRSVVTNSPKAGMIYLTVGDSQVGDTAKLSDCKTADIKVTKLKKGHRVVIYNNDKIIYKHVAKKYTEEFYASAEITEPGFIRAEIEYDLNPVMDKLMIFGEKTFMGKRGKETDTKKMPTLFWAFTNPIWIE